MTLREAIETVPQLGAVEWIGLRPAHGAAVQECFVAEAIAGRGLLGDVAALSTKGGNRQVSLFQAEHVPILGKWTDLDVRPAQLRRNLVISGINLVSLNKLRFAIGEEVILVGTGPCAPCRKMDNVLGAGGFQAMRGHGGITARIERGGTIRIGDTVRSLGAPPA